MMAVPASPLLTVSNIFPPLDESLYALGDEEKLFFKTFTKIEDDEELKKHIIAVQTNAYQVYAYPCIQKFGFTRFKISKQPTYRHILKLPNEHPNALLLDMACCFGNDVRKAVFDGWPIEQALASDLHPEFWKFGHDLFKSTPQTFPIPFLPGDAFDDAFLSIAGQTYPISSTGSSSPQPRPDDLRSLVSLNQLKGHLSAIHASSFFHLFDMTEQFELAKRMGSLLSPLPGSVLFGMQMGLPEDWVSPPPSGASRFSKRKPDSSSDPGIDISATLESIGGKWRDLSFDGENTTRMFIHTPESWKRLWDGHIFEKGSVNVEATLKEHIPTGTQQEKGEDPEREKHFFMIWAVTRL